MNKYSVNPLFKHPGYNGGGGGKSTPAAPQPAAAWTRVAPTTPIMPSRPVLSYNTPMSGLEGLLAAQAQYDTYGNQMQGFGRDVAKYQAQVPTYLQSVADYNTAAQAYNTDNQGKAGYSAVAPIKTQQGTPYRAPQALPDMSSTQQQSILAPGSFLLGSRGLLYKPQPAQAQPQYAPGTIYYV